MCDNCAPNVHKLKERAKYWYGVLTTDTKKEMSEKQAQENKLKNDLFQQMYPQLSDEEREKKQTLAQFSCSLSLKSYFHYRLEQKANQIDSQQEEIVERVRSCVQKAEHDIGQN